MIKDWKSLSYKLGSRSMICPECGKQIGINFARDHLLSHGLNPYVIKRRLSIYRYFKNNKLTEYPRCEVCGKYLIYNYNHHGFSYYCGNKCKAWDTKAYWTKTNRYKIPSDKEIEDHNIKVYLHHSTKDLYNFHSIGGKSGWIAQVNKWGTPIKGNRISLKLVDGRVLLLRSNCELYALLYLLYILKVGESNLITNKNNYEFAMTSTLGNAYTDFLIKSPSGSLWNFEVHDENDIETIERKRLCTHNNGWYFYLIPLWKTYCFKSKLLELKLSWINNIFNDLSKSLQNTFHCELQG